jgi:hypothetical protein
MQLRASIGRKLQLKGPIGVGYRMISLRMDHSGRGLVMDAERCDAFSIRV